MEALPGLRFGHCSLHCSRRSVVAKQDPVLLGLQQKSVFLRCCTLRARPVLKVSAQDGTTTESTENVLEELSQNEPEQQADSSAMALEGSVIEVKFVLEKKCKFGQRFNVVGNDPLFGNWEVDAAVPMNWADGDVWTVDVSVPAGKEFEFKFVLTGKKGEVIWQPGENRVFWTEESITPLVVTESWDPVDKVADLLVQDESKDSLNDTSTTSDTSIASDTNGMEVPIDSSGTDSVSKDEIVNALESKDEGADGHSALTQSILDEAPEVPVAELELAATAVKSIIGAEDTAEAGKAK